MLAQYGYHISALNQIQAVLSCRGNPDGAAMPPDYGLPTCIPMSDATFSVVTAVYTVGGLLGSLVANVVMDRAGRKGAVQASSALFVLGAAVMGAANSLWPLIIGRCATFYVMHGILVNMRSAECSWASVQASDFVSGPSSSPKSRPPRFRVLSVSSIHAY